MSTLFPPFNLNKWIKDNRNLLKPPVGNKNLYVQAEDFIVMIVGGPNSRKDYHYNETEELFYQIEGDIVVKTQQGGKMVAGLDFQNRHMESIDRGTQSDRYFGGYVNYRKNVNNLSISPSPSNKQPWDDASGF